MHSSFCCGNVLFKLRDRAGQQAEEQTGLAQREVGSIAEGAGAWRKRGRHLQAGGGWSAGSPCPLTAMHCRMMQLCFIRPGPPNFFMSLQKWHSPHSVRRQASHLRHRVRRRRAPAVVRLAANFTAEAGPSFPLGRPMARFCRTTHGTGERGCRPAGPQQTASIAG